MCVVAWLLRLSSLVNFISETILLGFKAGAALTIAMTQLPRLFGVKGGGHGFFESAVTLGSQLPDTNFAVLAFGLAALAVLLLGERPGAPTRRGPLVLSRSARLASLSAASQPAAPAVLPGNSDKIVVIVGACRHPAARVDFDGVANVHGERQRAADTPVLLAVIAAHAV